MSQIYGATQASASSGIDQIRNDIRDRSVKDKGSNTYIPDAQTSIDADELPILAAPAGPLSLDTLVSAIGNEVRRQACQDGVDSLEAKADRQKEINAKELEEMMKQLEDMKSKSTADGFLKAFQVIGMVLGALASVGSIVLGAATGNPLLIASGVVGIALTADSALSMATDGKICIGGLASTIAKSCGASEEQAQMVALGVSMAVTIASMVLSIASGIGAGKAAAQGAAVAAKAASQGAAVATQGAAKAASQGSSIIKILSKVEVIGSYCSAANSVALGSSQIASASYGYQIAESQADVKELEAILERIRASIEMEQTLIESEMQRANDLTAAVKEIVDNCNATQTAMLSMNPTMA